MSRTLKALVHRHIPLSSHLPLPARWPPPVSTGAILQFRRHDGGAEQQRTGTGGEHPFGARPPDTHSANETALRCPGF
jgi:hypothetical protein